MAEDYSANATSSPEVRNAPRTAGTRRSPSALPTSFHDPTVIHEVGLETWRSILTAAGESGRLDATSSHDELWLSLTTNPPGEQLIDALEVVNELGTDTGRDLLLYAADDRQVRLGAVDDEPARELAARIWLQSRTDTPLAEVLMRARLNAYEASHVRPYREFVGERARSTGPLDRERLLDAVTRWCRENGKSEAIEVYITPGTSGEWRCEVLRGEAAKRVVEIRNRRPEILNYRPGVADHLRYDGETGRLGVATRSPRLLRMYREVLGSLLADSQTFFSNESICTLKPLQEQGRALFERSRIPGILRVDVVELRWRRGDREKVWVKGPDCFRLLIDLGAQLHEGELIEARLAVWLPVPDGEALSPSRCPAASTSTPVRRKLLSSNFDEVGIRGAFGRDDERLDLWSLYPWRMNDEAWRRQVGASEFDRLVRRTALRSVRLDAVTHANHPDAANALDVEAVDANTIVGLSEDAAIPLRTLTPSDVMGYELDVTVVAGEIGAALELQGAGGIADGVWSLGRRVLSPSVTIAAFLASRAPANGAAHAIRASANGARPVLLVPLNRATREDVPQIECRLPTGPYDGLVGSIVERLNLQDLVSPAVWLREDLILHPENGAAWYRGVPLSKLRADSHPFKFALEVVRAGGRPVTKAALNAVLSPASNDDSVAKKAKKDFIDRVTASFEEAGQECPADVKEVFISQGGGYVLNATARLLS